MQAQHKEENEKLKQDIKKLKKQTIAQARANSRTGKAPGADGSTEKLSLELANMEAASAKAMESMISTGAGGCGNVEDTSTTTLKKHIMRQQNAVSVRNSSGVLDSTVLVGPLGNQAHTHG